MFYQKSRLIQSQKIYSIYRLTLPGAPYFQIWFVSISIVSNGIKYMYPKTININYAFWSTLFLGREKKELIFQYFITFALMNLLSNEDKQLDRQTKPKHWPSLFYLRQPGFETVDCSSDVCFCGFRVVGHSCHLCRGWGISRYRRSRLMTWKQMCQIHFYLDFYITRKKFTTTY